MEILQSHKGRRVDGELTICEKHRQLADLLITELGGECPQKLEQIMPLLNSAYLDGIRLVDSLIARKLSLPRWAGNNVLKAALLREQRIRMAKELHAAGHCL